MADNEVLQGTEARLNITYGGQNGDLPDTVAFDASDADIRTWATEAVRAGSVPGLRRDDQADFRDFVVDRFPATEARPYNLVQIRPKTPFGPEDGEYLCRCAGPVLDYSDDEDE